MWNCATLYTLICVELKSFYWHFNKRTLKIVWNHKNEHWKYLNWNFVYSISGCRVDFNIVEFEILWNCTTQDNKMCIWPSMCEVVWCNEQFLFAHVFNKQLSVISQMHLKDIETNIYHPYRSVLRTEWPNVEIETPNVNIFVEKQ